MKPYKERLPLIDAAIDALKEWSLSKPHSLVRVKHNGSWVYAFTDDRITMGGYVGTRDEFNQRKAERQNKPSWSDAPEWANWLAQDADGQWAWYESVPEPDEFWWYLPEGRHSDLVEGKYEGLPDGEVIDNWQDTLEQRPETEDKEQPMKYEYGIEYETNGEKPDLPDDVRVIGVGMRGGSELGAVKDVFWNGIKKFRIVDKRYKPKEQDMNNWYERGELPPVGADCEFNRTDDAKFDDNLVDGAKVEVIATTKTCHGGDIIIFKYDYIEPSTNIKNTGVEYSTIENLRPLRTETDNLQQDILDHWNEKGVDCPISEWDLANHLHALGYRKFKPMSEKEFMKQCVDICGHGDTRLHRAGCRFLDQGE